MPVIAFLPEGQVLVALLSLFVIPVHYSCTLRSKVVEEDTELSYGCACIVASYERWMW
jgi:hypothetical protein